MKVVDGDLVQKPSYRSLARPRHHRSQALGRGKGRGKPLLEGIEGCTEDVNSKPPVAQRASGIYQEEGTPPRRDRGMYGRRQL